MSDPVISAKLLERLERGDLDDVTYGEIRAIAFEVVSSRADSAELVAFANFMLDRNRKARDHEYAKNPRILGRIEGEEAIASKLASGAWRRWRVGRSDLQHVARVDSDQESVRRGGSTRTAACSCGWVGPQRSTLALAADDATEHEREAGGA